jgi:hypothetical protein
MRVTVQFVNDDDEEDPESTLVDRATFTTSATSSEEWAESLLHLLRFSPYRADCIIRSMLEQMAVFGPSIDRLVTGMEPDVISKLQAMIRKATRDNKNKALNRE